MISFLYSVSSSGLGFFLTVQDAGISSFPEAGEDIMHSQNWRTFPPHFRSNHSAAAKPDKNNHSLTAAILASSHIHDNGYLL
jgi:hypothetical protein